MKLDSKGPSNKCPNMILMKDINVIWCQKYHQLVGKTEYNMIPPTCNGCIESGFENSTLIEESLKLDGCSIEGISTQKCPVYKQKTNEGHCELCQKDPFVRASRAKKRLDQVHNGWRKGRQKTSKKLSRRIAMALMKVEAAIPEDQKVKCEPDLQVLRERGHQYLLKLFSYSERIQ